MIIHFLLSSRPEGEILFHSSIRSLPLVEMTDSLLTIFHRGLNLKYIFLSNNSGSGGKGKGDAFRTARSTER